MPRNLAVMHTASNNIIVIVEGTSPKLAAAKADKERNITNRDFREVHVDRADIEYVIYELDESDVRLFSDRDRFGDPKYTGYVKINCKKVGNVVVA